MTITTSHRQEIIFITLRHFTNFPIITDEYINNVLDAYLNNNSIDGFTTSTDDYQTCLNSTMYLALKIQIFIYYYLCQLAKTDSTILSQLIEDKIAYCNNLNTLSILSNKEYLRQAILSYDGQEDFDTYLAKRLASLHRQRSKKISKPPVSNSNVHHNDNSGLSPKDEFVATIQEFGIEDLINSTDPSFNQYLALRLGHIDNKYFTLEEITTITNQEYQTILQYEKNLLGILRQQINTNIDKYLKLLLTQKQS